MWCFTGIDTAASVTWKIGGCFRSKCVCSNKYFGSYICKSFLLLLLACILLNGVLSLWGKSMRFLTINLAGVSCLSLGFPLHIINRFQSLSYKTPLKAKVYVKCQFCVIERSSLSWWYSMGYGFWICGLKGGEKIVNLS